MISIIIPTYGRGKEIRDCLSSLRSNSSYANEILVMSPDPSPELNELCIRFSARAVNDHSRVGGQRLKSLWGILNDGISLARREYVCWLNDDCVVNPGWDAAAISYFDASVGMVVLKTKGINGNPEYEMGPGYYGVPCANYAILRKSAGIRFDEKYSWFYGDADISLQMAAKTRLRVVGTKEGLVIHAHVVDNVRRENEQDPRARADRSYFDHKWSYKKRKGGLVVDMNAAEKLQAKAVEFLRAGYHRAMKWWQ